MRSKPDRPASTWRPGCRGGEAGGEPEVVRVVGGEGGSKWMTWKGRERQWKVKERQLKVSERSGKGNERQGKVSERQ